MLTNPLITAVAEQHRRDLMTQAGLGSWPAPHAATRLAGPTGCSRPRRLADSSRTLNRTGRQRPQHYASSHRIYPGVEIDPGKKVRHGN